MNIEAAAQVGWVLMLAVVGIMHLRHRRLEKRLLDAEESLMTERLRAGAERMARTMCDANAIKQQAFWPPSVIAPFMARKAMENIPATTDEKVDAILNHLGLVTVIEEGRKVTLKRVNLAPMFDTPPQPPQQPKS